MTRLDQKIATLEKALISLEESFSKLASNKDTYFYKELRDSVIKRFEYTIDYLWKTLKLYIEKKHEILSAESPKKIFDQAKRSGVITEQELVACRRMIEDRNNTCHMYQEELSEAVVNVMDSYISNLKVILSKLK